MPDGISYGPRPLGAGGPPPGGGASGSNIDKGMAGAAYEMMGSTLLSQQPVTQRDTRAPRVAKWWAETYGHCESRLNALKTWRYSWWVYWSKLAEYFSPRRYLWLAVANRTWRGNPINDQIIDSTGLQALNTCSSGLWTGLTSPSRPWFQLDQALSWVTLDQAALAWLETTQKKLYVVLAQSNFYNVMAQAFADVMLFGTAPVIIYEDFEDVIRCYLPCAGEYYLAIGSRLSVDTLYREFTLTVAQVVEMFTFEKCPGDVQRLWMDGGSSIDQEVVVAHAIEPNFKIPARGGTGQASGSMVPDVFTYREIYWLRGNKSDEPLSARGFHSTPFMAARWNTVSNDAYGRSPCMDALGDNKQIQLETRRKAEFIEKGVRPPMGASVEMKNEPASIIPGHITYTSTANGQKGFWPLFEPNPAWLQGITADIEMVSQRLQRCLFVDIFMAITNMEGVQPRNELELTKRDLERLQVLGPFISLFETEFAGPAIQRVLDILIRRRMIDPLPDSLKGVPLKVNFTSIMRLAQQSAESVAMKDVFSTAGALASAAQAAGIPNPIRILNLDKAMREYASMNSYPISCVFTEDEVFEHDQARSQAQAAAQQPQNLMAAVQAAHTLSQTSTGGGTALSALTGGAGGGLPGS